VTDDSLERRRVDILFVEDDEELRSATSELLRDEGFRVAEAENGARALDYLNRGNVPSLVILDLLMPGLDGFQFITRVRNAPKLRDIPILVLSGATKTGLLAGLQNVVAHLSKPFSAEELVACVRKFAASPRG
jgi:two-component system, chemotaxis family, chemotaxis protein CheY